MDQVSEPYRARAPGLHRRDLDQDQYGTPTRLGAARPAPLARVPHGRWKTLTFIAALRHDRVAAPWLIEGPINGESFRVYLEKVLAPTLAPDDIVVMDMCGRPRWCKKNLSKSTERGRVLTCVRPLMRPSHAAGPYGSSRSGSNSISRARGTYP